MSWTRRIWQNFPSIATAISAGALNNIEEGVEEAVTATRGRLSDANLASAYVSVYASAATRAATAPLMAKLKRGEQDASYLYIGDSTGNATDEHVYLEAVALGARFPAYTVLYRLWNDGTGAYDAATTIQTGTGARTLTVWNLSVSGKAPGYVLGSRWANGVAALTGLDLLFVSHSHNMGDPTPSTNGGLPIRWNFLALTEEFAIQHPQAGIVLMSQNPTTLSGRETWQAKKAQIIQELAAQRGYGFIDVHQAFVDYAAANGVTVDSLLVDQIHPGATGQGIWAALVGASLRYTSDAGLTPRQASAFTVAAPSISGNNTGFTDWSGTNPDGWTATNATLSKDTTNFETGTYGMQVTAGGSAGEASAVLTTGSTSFGQGKRISGRYITVAARVFVPASYTGTPSLVVMDSGGGAQQARVDVASDTRDRFHWLIVTKRVVSPGTSVTIKLAARLSGSAAGSVTFDRFSVVEGDLPREVVNGTPGPAGAAGTSAGQMDFISTAGDHPGALLALTSAGAGVIAANSANFWKVRPHRDISVSVLEWQVHTQSGNYDIGIYAADGTRLWSKGSTAVPAAGAVVETVSPAVAFTAGTIYLLAIAFDNTTVLARGSVLGSGNILKLADGSASGFNVATSFPLPSSITPSTSQTNRFQAISVRSA